MAYGMRVVPYVPRCLAGCLILHVGLDLVKEALYDSLGAFDSLEYGCIVAIGFVMTVFGFSSGLLFALVASTLIFTIQQAVHGNPVRGTMRGTTLRSSKWRTAAARSALDNAMGSVLVVQVVGTLFFGNATELKERVPPLGRNQTFTAPARSSPKNDFVKNHRAPDALVDFHTGRAGAQT